jgi:peptidoglycan/LPS O-acetylase OafA/YrhL
VTPHDTATEPAPEVEAVATTGRYHPGHSTYPALDGLRALAVLAVVTTHAAFWTGRYERGWGGAALTRLDSGVAIFFVLSGFLLVRPWLVSAVHRTPSPSVRVYAVRRVARIMPAYLVAVTAAMLLIPDNATATVADWVRHVFLVQIYQYGWLKGGLTQTWSLCTEWAFYLVLPLIGWVVVRATRTRWRPGLLLTGMVGLLFLPLAWYLFLYNTTGPVWVTGGIWLPAYLGWFGGGMALAVIRVHLDHGDVDESSRWWFAEELGRRPFTCWALAAVAFFAAMTPIAGPRSLVATTIGQSFTKQTLYVIMAMALAWPAVFGRSAVTEAVFGNPVARFAGDISYGVFLYHLVVLEGVMHLLDNPLFTGKVIQVLPLTLAGSVAVATVSFRFLERPLIQRAHRYRPRGSAPARSGPPTDRVPAATG